MPLTDRDCRNLKDLARRGDTAVELQNDGQIKYWRDMEKRGYARISETARCGLERLRGTFVSITEAGRAAV